MPAAARSGSRCHGGPGTSSASRACSCCGAVRAVQVKAVLIAKLVSIARFLRERLASPQRRSDTVRANHGQLQSENVQTEAVPWDRPERRYDLAIFDFDGTLADSAIWMAGVFNDVADRFGYRRVSEDELQMLRGRSNREIVRYLGVPAWKLPFIAT